MKFPEQQYLDLLRHIHTKGVWEDTRQISTVTNQPLQAKTVLGATMRFQPEDGMPLIGLRPLGRAFAWFIGEMLWILSGSTKLEQLQKYGVHYWDPWNEPDKREFVGLEDGELGPTYGKQWRAFQVGDTQEIDQIATLVTKLQDRPTDRALMVTPWHPRDINHLVIKPCHGAFHVRVIGGKLGMIVTQRSADFPVGIPSNLVMYRFLQMLLAAKSGIPIGELVYNMHDVHYYSDQQPGVEKLLARTAQPFPSCTLNPILVEVFDRMLEGVQDPLASPEINPMGKPYEELIREWVPLSDYHPHPRIPYAELPVAV